MTRTITKTLYQFDELTDRAKETARMGPPVRASEALEESSYAQN